MIDLSQLEEPGKKFCVRCFDEESTLAFLDEMFEQYPEKCKYWTRGENKWGKVYGGYIDYFPYLNGVDGTNLCWDGERYAEENDYIIVNYTDLPGATGLYADFGEIGEQVADFSLLFDTALEVR